MTDRLYVDVHILQTVPPSNLNRDDSGSPKHATYGGARRARVSSQAWKRATRMALRERDEPVEIGTRTKKISAMLATRITELTTVDSEQATRLATALLKPLGIKPAQRKADETSYLLFFGRDQLDAIVNLVSDLAGELVALPDDDLEKAVRDIPVVEELGRGHPIDVALFGRMVADLASLNVDAATQVAHAISTHRVEPEFDYYTAVDDENPREETGAGMIGTVEFNSATLYRYATVGVHQLLGNLGDRVATARAVELFLDCFARSMPTGHGNTFAHRTLPHLVAVTLCTDQPVNLVSAFEKPVFGRAGIAEESAALLAVESLKVDANWGLSGRSTMATYTATGNGVADKLAEAFGPALAFPQLQVKTRAAVAEWLDAGES